MTAESKITAEELAEGLVLELRRAALELGDWIENEAVPARVAKDMMARLISIRATLKPIAEANRRCARACAGS